MPIFEIARSLYPSIVRLELENGQQITSVIWRNVSLDSSGNGIYLAGGLDRQGLPLDVPVVGVRMHSMTFMAGLYTPTEGAASYRATGVLSGPAAGLVTEPSLPRPSISSDSPLSITLQPYPDLETLTIVQEATASFDLFVSFYLSGDVSEGALVLAGGQASDGFPLPAGSGFWIEADLSTFPEAPTFLGSGHRGEFLKQRYFQYTAPTLGQLRCTAEEAETAGTRLAVTGYWEPGVLETRVFEAPGYGVRGRTVDIGELVNLSPYTASLVYYNELTEEADVLGGAVYTSQNTENRPVTPPQNLRATASLDGRSIYISWENVINNGSTFDGYSFYLVQGGKSTDGPAVESETFTWTLDEPLTPGETYALRVFMYERTYDGVRMSSPNAIVTFTVPSFSGGDVLYWDGDTAEGVGPAGTVGRTYYWADGPGSASFYRTHYPDGWADQPLEEVVEGGPNVPLHAAIEGWNPLPYTLGNARERQGVLITAIESSSQTVNVLSSPIALSAEEVVSAQAWITFHPVSGLLPRRFRLQIVSNDGTVLASGDWQFAPPSGEPAPISASQAAIPAGVTFCKLVIQIENGVGTGDRLAVHRVMLTNSPAPVGYFDGSLPPTPQWVYAWEGEPDASPSTRSRNENYDPLAAFVDPDCPPVPEPPRPPVVDPACGVDEPDLWRRWWVPIGTEDSYEWWSVLPTVTISTGAQAERSLRIRFWPNPDEDAPLAFDTNEHEFTGELILNYLPPNSTVVLDGVSRRLQAILPDGTTQGIDRLLSGSDGAPPEWPVLSCETAWLISFDTINEGSRDNLDVSVSLTTRMG